MMNRTRGWKWIAVAALGGAVGAGCDGGGGGSGGSAGDEGGSGGSSAPGGSGGSGGGATTSTGVGGAGPAFAEVHAILEAGGCTNGYCHGGGTGTLLMTADADGTYAELVEQPAGGMLCGPSGLMRVMPGDAENSLLWQKVAPGVTPCGDKMPPQAAPLGDAQVETVRAWIAGGANK
jgi:hypothetical protein